MKLLRFLRSLAISAGFTISACLVFHQAPSSAQPAGVQTPGESAKLLEDVRLQIARGRSQFEANQITAVDTLRAAAQLSLDNLVAFVGPQVLTAAPEEMPSTGFFASATRQAAEAHYWWGRAADQSGRRDEAIAALSRAARFAGRVRPSASDTLARDALLALGGALRDGLPIVAPDDTLNTVAEIAHGKLWAPRRFSWSISPAALTPTVAPLTGADQELLQREFLVTNGRVYPPVPSSTVDTTTSLSRTPPIYRNVPADALPGVLRLDRMVIGYELQRSGPEQGLWRQVVRVFYPSTFLTRGRREDRLRAEAMCAQFLKVHTLFDAALGAGNPYARDGVTTLWLSELTAMWPSDDADPRVRAALGPVMPRVNTQTNTSTPVGPSRNSPPEVPEIEIRPFSFPWRTTAGLESSAFGELLLFNLPQQRGEAEWLRQLMHEYGHVALPAIDGFKAPLEPFANGLLGETVGALWAAATPAAWTLPAPFDVSLDDGQFAQALQAHVAQEALPALQAWKLLRGPGSTARREYTEKGLQYLQGTAVFMERVYGAKALGAAFAPLLHSSAPATTDALMTSFAAALRDPFKTGGLAPAGVLPIWLPGALEGNSLTPEDLINRSSWKMKTGDRVTCWLFVPATASTLRLEWKSANISPGSLRSDPVLTATPVLPASGANVAVEFDLKNRSGWQRFGFTARTNLEISAAQFQKSAR